MRKIMKKQSTWVTALLSLMITGLVHAAPLKIGANPGPTGDTVEIAAAEARKQGLDVQVVEISDWVTPNVALQSGDLDLNYFQHKAFLDNAVANNQYDFAVAGYGFLPSIGLFSTKLKSLADIKDGGKVAVANDPINQARGLLLAERAGLIKLKAGAGSKATIDDITSNPKKLKFIEIEGPQLIRALDDVDVAQGYPARYVTAGKPDIAKNGLVYSPVDDTLYALLFVARKNNVNDPRVQKFVQIYQNSPAVAAKIAELYLNDKKLYSLPWKK
jgi:D-methionine transport system substrate-binding protein